MMHSAASRYDLERFGMVSSHNAFLLSNFRFSDYLSRKFPFSDYLLSLDWSEWLTAVVTLWHYFKR